MVVSFPSALNSAWVLHVSDRPARLSCCLLPSRLNSCRRLEQKGSSWDSNEALRFLCCLCIWCYIPWVLLSEFYHFSSVVCSSPIHLEIILLEGDPVFLLERISFPHQVILPSLLQISRPYTRGFASGLSSFPAVSAALLMSVPYCFDYCSLEISFGIRKCESFNFVPFFFLNYFF